MQADPRLQRLQEARKAGPEEPRLVATAQVVSRRRHGTPSDSEDEAGSGPDQDEPGSEGEEGAGEAESEPEEDDEALARRAALRARCVGSRAARERGWLWGGGCLGLEEA